LSLLHCWLKFARSPKVAANVVAAWRGFFCVAPAAEKILPNCLLWDVDLFN